MCQSSLFGSAEGHGLLANPDRLTPLQNPNAPCATGNSASYDNIDDGIQDLVATLVPHATQDGLCSWVITTQLAAGPRFRDSDYTDMVSFRGAGLSDYGAGTRMFFKGQQQYFNTLPGPANCADTVSML